MPKIKYVDGYLRATTQDKILRALRIIQEYKEQGLSLTLRQIYYQFVARGFIKNNIGEYKKLGRALKQGRLFGMIDWLSIEDRTRFLRGLPDNGTPEEAIRNLSLTYHRSLWSDQKSYVEVWIEKDALVGVIAPVCNKWDVDYYSCRGYNSESEMWAAGQRILYAMEQRKTPYILYLGDHDPSGINMVPDIENRISMFIDFPFYVDRLALRMEQVRKYNPPENFAKETDSRYKRYVKQYGTTMCWELDALDPKILHMLIEDKIKELVDEDKFNYAKKSLEEDRKKIVDLSENYETFQRLIARFDSE